MAKLTTNVTLNGTTVDVTLYHDSDGDGVSDQSETVSGIADGTNTYDLSTVDFISGDDYWVEWSISGSTTSSPSIHSVEAESSGPSNLTVDAVRDTEVDLSWDDPNASAWDVYRAESSGSTTADYTKVADVTSKTYTDTGLENGERYYYRVTQDGDTTVSNEADGITTLPAPSGLSLDASVEDEISLSWSNNDNSSDGTIEVLRSIDGTTGTSVASFTTLTTTSYTDTALNDGEKYYYTIRRSTDHRDSDSGQNSDITILPAASGVSLDTSIEDEITASWTDNADNEDGFRLLGGLSEAWEDETFSTWTTPYWNKVTDRIYDGSYSGYYKASDTDTTGIMADKAIHPGGAQPDYIEYIWQETSYSWGGGISIVDSAGNEVFGMADDNPQWDIKDANGWRQVYGGDGYDRWIKYRIEFDWVNGNCSIYFEDLSTGSVYKESGIPLINATDVETLEIRNYHSDSWRTGSQFEMWIDAIQSGYINSVTANSTSATITGLEDGERYLFNVETYTEHVETYSGLSSGITVLPSASSVSLDTSIEDEITASWTNNDDNDSGDIEVYRSDDGTLGTSITTLSITATSHTDTGLTDGKQYFYTLRRNTPHTFTDSSQVSGITVLPASSLDTLDASVEDEITSDWTKTDDNSNGDYTIYRSTDGTKGVAIDSITDLTITSYTDGGLTDGTEYFYIIERNTPDTSSDSNQLSAITILPEPTLDSVDTSIEDEITVGWTKNDDSSDGNFEIFRREDGTTHSSVATNTNLSNLDYTDTGLEDGEQFYYKIRRNTPDTSADSSESNGHITILPAVSGLLFYTEAIGRVEIDWTSEDDSPDGDVQVWRSTDGSLGSQIASGLSPSTTHYEDDTVSKDVTYSYTIRRETDHTLADTQDSTTTVDSIERPITTMRWGHMNDWDSAEIQSGYMHSDIAGSNYVSDKLQLGIDPSEWDGLLAYYVFDDTGPTVTDYSGAGNDGEAMSWDSTNQEPTTSHTVEYGYSGLNDTEAWYLDEANKDFVQPPDFGIYGDTAFTWIGMVYCMDVDTKAGGLFKFGKVDSGECWSLQYRPDNGGDAIVYGVFGTEETYVEVSEPLLNRWAVMGTIYDPANNRKAFWLDGIEEHSKSINPVDLVDDRYFIGGYPWGETESDGSHTHWTEVYYDTFMLFDRALTDSEMERIHDSVDTASLTTPMRDLK